MRDCSKRHSEERIKDVLRKEDDISTRSKLKDAKSEKRETSSDGMRREGKEYERGQQIMSAKAKGESRDTNG